MRSLVSAALFLAVGQLACGHVRAQGLSWTCTVERDFLLQCTTGNGPVHERVVPVGSTLDSRGNSAGVNTTGLNATQSLAALHDAQGQLAGFGIRGNGWATGRLVGGVTVLDEGTLVFDLTCPTLLTGAFTISARHPGFGGPAIPQYGVAIDRGSGPLTFDQFWYADGTGACFELPAVLGPTATRLRVRTSMWFGVGSGESDGWSYDLQIRFVPGITAVTHQGSRNCGWLRFRRDGAGPPMFDWGSPDPRWQSFLVYGLQAQTRLLPSPFIGCPLWVTPDVIVPQPQSSPFAFLPPQLPPGFAIHVQAAVLGTQYPYQPSPYLQLTGALHAVGQ